jgi:hypothetical protein
VESVGERQESLQSDSPASIDEFGAHERIAQSIFKLIDGSEGGKTIAIEGAWGAGKSTVIRLLAAKCSTHSTGVFLYDAWVHAGDPLRRAFLASLIDYLQQREWLPRTDKWQDELDLVAGKQRRTTKSVTPQITRFGRLLALSLLGLPLGLASLSKAFDAIAAAKSIHVDSWSVGLFWIGLTLCLLPILLCAFHYVMCRVTDVRAHDYFALFLSKQTSVESMVVTDSGDPTSIEFQSLFVAALEAALAGKKNRKLVLVIDNLDRLSADEVQKAWSLLQSFVEISSTADVPELTRLWVIVPVAPSFMAAEVGADAAEPAARALAPSFLDKVFQARFKLPPPILKNWQPYLDRLLCKAIPAATLDDRQKIVALYVALRRSHDMPTPRDIVLFVNQLAIFSTQWSSDYALAVGAAYILEGSDDALERLQRNEIPSPVARRMVSGDLKEAYSCIYFNTGDAADALELLQGPIARKLLIDAESREIGARIAEHASFAPILLRAYTAAVDTWVHDEPRKVIEVSLAIVNALDVRSSPTPVVLAREAVSRDILDTVLRTVSWAIVEMDDAPVIYTPLADLVSRSLDICARYQSVDRLEVVRALGQSVARPFGDQSQTKKMDAASLGDYIAGVVALADLKEMRDELLRTSDRWNTPAWDEEFRTLLTSLDGSQVSLSIFQPVGGPSGVVDFISKEIAGGSLSSEDLILINWLEAVQGPEIRPVVKAIEARLDLSTVLAPIAAVNLGLFILQLQSRSDDFSDQLSHLVQSLLAEAERQVDEDEFAGAAALVLPSVILLQRRRADGVSLISSSGLAAFFRDPMTQSTLVDQLRLYVAQFSSGASFLSSVIAEPGLGPLAAAIFVDRKSLDSVLTQVDLEGCVENIEKVGSAFGDKTWDLVDRFLTLRSGEPGLAQSIIERARREDGRRWISRAMTLQLDLSDDVYAAAVGALVAKSSEGWLKSANVFTWDALLVGQLIQNEIKIVLPMASSLVRSLIKSTEVSNSFKWTTGNLQVFMRSLRTAQQLEIAKEAFEVVRSGHVPLTSEFWSVAGPMIDGHVRRPVIRPYLLEMVRSILSTPSVPAIVWLHSFVASGGDISGSLSDRENKALIYGLINRQLKNAPKDDVLKAPLEKFKRLISKSSAGKFSTRGGTRSRRSKG